MDDTDLYEVLGVSASATKDEIKKAYHKAARSHHPDKAAPEDQEEATARFKTIKAAYEILYDDDRRRRYDTHGMDFEAAYGGGAGMNDPDLEDLLSQMFGMGGGVNGMGGMGGSGGGRPAKARNEEQEYEVTLEDLYKGKTTKFASTKNVVCSTCSGSGGKDKAKPHTCAVCGGKGMTARLRSVGPHLVANENVPCGTCSGAGKVYKDKDRCKRCKGKRVTQTKKVLELYIPPGSRGGDKIVLSGEADQIPGQEPGDLIFVLEETKHDIFSRSGPDLKADIHVSLAEALTGFDRVVIKHLDGRGIQLAVRQPRGKVLRPGQVLRIAGEGMPIKKSSSRGDLYLIVEVEFPKDGWIKDKQMIQKLRNVLPSREDDGVKAEIVDEVNFDILDSLDSFGSSDGPGGDWEDVVDDDEGGPQCATQ